MANSEFEYVRHNEQWDALLPGTWIVVRIDGRAFSKFTKRYDFTKPNDARAIDLMNSAAREVMKSMTDIVVAYGQSDEYSFVFHKHTNLFERRSFKLVTTVATVFSVNYALLWPHFFPNQPLTQPFPTFDGRPICYADEDIRNYLSWRQADCHVNNLYNTTFWAMVLKGGQSPTDAELELKGSLSADKNEILFSRFGINYNNEPDVFKKGTVVYRDLGESTSTSTAPSTDSPAQSRSAADREKKKLQKASIVTAHVDIISDAFWDQRPWILASDRKRGRRQKP